jgi:lipopolysaccharide/colanic/teichoic acid biosynthesis glycosyltransferase
VWNWLRQARYRAATPRAPAIIGTPSALNRLKAGHKTAPLLVPIVEPGAPDWDRKIARVARLMGTSRIDRLIVALPLPAGCQSEVALARMIELDGSVSLVDTEASPAKIALGISAARRVQLLIKGIIDRVGAAFLVTVLAPLLLLVAALIRLTSRGPVFFVQPRLGRHNLVIPVIKFRTMYADQGDRLGACRTVPGDPRVTRLGRILRRWSIDELPQLFNVLAGHMSLVGPRPHAVMMKAGERLYFEALPAYLDRHSVKPGITGWAQVNRLSGQVDSLEGGRARLAYDLDYIEKWSLWLDLKIFVMTSTVFFDRVNRY